MKQVIGITIGDINGVGPEVIIRALSDERILDQFVPVIYGSTKVLSYHKNIVKPNLFDYHGIQDAQAIKIDRINVINVWNDEISIELGQGTEDSGKLAYTALDRAVHDLNSGLIDALVTAPINKHTMKLADFPHPGHTEFLESRCGGRLSLMLMVQDELRIGVVTNHIPLRDVDGVLTKELIKKKAKILCQTLQMDFGIERPKVAVLGLNPHAGDRGTIGDEEDKLIRPVVAELAQAGYLITGPHPPDGFFGAGHYRKVDGILAMYHDQGLIPFKTLAFGQGVNFTAGLAVVRTSPDHGTGFDIAGKNLAEPQSFRNALFLAADVLRNRALHAEAREEVLSREQLDEDSGVDEALDPETIER